MGELVVNLDSGLTIRCGDEGISLERDGCVIHVDPSEREEVVEAMTAATRWHATRQRFARASKPKKLEE